MTSAERFDLPTRLRVEASRALLRWVARTPRVRDRLLARRAADVEAGLDPDTAIVLELARLTRDDQAAKSTPAVERHRLRVSIAIADAAPEGQVVVAEHVVDGADGAIPARLYEPRGLARPSPGLVFIHGGGWVTGDLESHDTWCRRLALRARARVLAIAPRLAPEHPFPAAADDAVAAFRDVASRADELGFDPERIGVCGDSAGGNLAAVVGLDTRSERVRPSVTGLFYPALDATMSQPSIRSRGTGYFLTEASIRWYVDHYLGDDPARRTNPRVSPLLAPDLSGAPRAIVVVADFDPLVDEGLAYAKRLEESGTKVELLRYRSLIHGFLLMTSSSRAACAAADEVATRMGDALRDG